MKFKKIVLAICLVLNIQHLAIAQDTPAVDAIEYSDFQWLKDQVDAWKYIPKEQTQRRIDLLSSMIMSQEYSTDENFKKSCKNSLVFINKVLFEELSLADRNQYIEANTAGWFAWKKKIHKKANSQQSKDLKDYKLLDQALEFWRLSNIDNLKKCVDRAFADNKTQEDRNYFKATNQICRHFSNIRNVVDEDEILRDDIAPSAISKMQKECSLKINELIVRAFDARDKQHLERIIIKNAEVFAILIKKCKFDQF